jgi:hypothetical protein
MNRIERRIAGADNTKPGSGVCNPGEPAVPRRGMLGGMSLLYKSQESKSISNVVSIRNPVSKPNINSQIESLKKKDNKLTELERKIAIFEETNAINISILEEKIRQQNIEIEKLKKYIKQTDNSDILEDNNVLDNNENKTKLSQETDTPLNNITLSINEN